MKILALDTSTELCSVALWIDGKLLTREAETARGAAELILPMIDALLREAGLKLRELDAIAFGRGPGGFTGVRLSASVTQGLAFGAGLPIVPVSDLAVVAFRALVNDPAASRVLVCNDARMQEVYWAYFDRGTGDKPILIGTEHVGPASAVPMDEPAQAITIGAGLGFRAYPELATRVARVQDTLLPHAAGIAMLAVDAPRLPAQEAIPVYVRDEVVRPAVINP
jgi:tRNA threonylcarbamoyladenosine biosynthesis protein TsaB